MRAQPGLVDEAATDLESVTRGADCVILAMPTGAMGSVVERISSLDGTLVTDVGSVKGPVMREIEPLVAERGGRFVGSHPMAGSEKVGLAYAEPDLFVEAAVILTGGVDRPDRDHDVELLQSFWRGLGAIVSVMDGDRHDAVVAAISHLPHLLAAALVRTVLPSDPEAGNFCGGGFRDTTRVAAGPEDMWSGILVDNQEAVSNRLEDLIDELKTWKGALDALDRDQLRGFLSEARQLRETIRDLSPGAPD